MHTRRPKFFKSKFSLFLVPALMASALTVAVGPATIAQTLTSLLKLDFETGTTTGWKQATCCSYSVQPNQTSFVRTGKYSARFELRKGDPDIQGSRRAELELKPVAKNSEYWYGFSTRFPSSWTYDQSFEILSQWHSVPDLSLGEAWGSPPLSLSTKYDKIRLINRWDPKVKTLNNDPRPEGGIATLYEGTYKPGEWIDWVVRAKWSYQADGILQVWRNGQLIVDKRGPNTYNDPYGPYFKTGIYKPDWKYKPSASSTTVRSFYVDEFRMMKQSDGGSYTAVAPPGLRPGATATSTTSTTTATTTSPTTTTTSPTTTTTSPTTTTTTTSGLTTTAGTTSSLLKLDFETGTTTGWKLATCCSYSVQPNQTKFVRSGAYSARFELRKGDPDIQGSRRAELELKPVAKNSEYWYGFSTRFPSSWTYDQSFEILSQWHSVPDFSLGEEWRSPPLSFVTKYNTIKLVNRWDPKPKTLNNDPRPEGGIATIWEGTYTPGEWTDWVVHAKWSYQSDGILRVWRNGQLILDKRGPNTYNDPYGPYFKTGIYKPDWKYKPSASSTTVRSFYVDEFRMMKQSDGGSYTAVAPPGFRPGATASATP